MTPATDRRAKFNPDWSINIPTLLTLISMATVAIVTVGGYVISKERWQAETDRRMRDLEAITVELKAADLANRNEQIGQFLVLNSKLDALTKKASQ